MPRYISRRPRADDDYWREPPFITNLTVMESDPVSTGLLDADGNEIVRMNDPIGFIHFGDTP